MEKTGKLYVVPTPIGNLEDMTFRAVRILGEVGLILAEDTRVSARLLDRYQIRNKLRSHHKFNEHGTAGQVAALIREGADVALISDAGTPGISDPGFLLVRTCLEQGVEVECLPGATALIPALVNAGFPTDRFVFEGFLPTRKGRLKRLESLAGETRTMVFYESPYRLAKLLQQLASLLGDDRKCCVCRELTKHFEENIRGTLGGLAPRFEKEAPRGEIVLVVAGTGKDKPEPTIHED